MNMTSIARRPAHALHALRLLHRWLGIAGAAFFVMWFGSGLVMTQIGFPSLSEAEHLRGLAPLALAEVVTTPDAALHSAGLNAFPRRMWLESLVREDGVARPVWRIVAGDGSHHTICAVTGARLDAVTPAQATRIAQAFAREPQARWTGTLERDQWTVPAALERQRPFHHIDIGDAAGTELYVSARTGEVVRDTRRRERIWNWFGAVPHWFYFQALREQSAIWRQSLLWVSGLCCLSALSGLMLGIIRLRLLRPGRITPFRGWMKLHHVAGLTGGLFIVTWIVSGWLSMSPAGWLRNTPPDAAAMARLAAPPDNPFPWPVERAALRECLGDTQWKEAQIYWLAGQARMTVVGAHEGEHQTFDLPSLRPASVSRQDVEAAARALFPDATPAAVTLLTREDRYWYSRRDTRELPVWRVELADAAETWLHFDARDGRLLGSLDRSARARRWLFNAPHSLELPAFADSPLLRDALLWALALPGFAVSISALVIGWRRLALPTTERSSS